MKLNFIKISRCIFALALAFLMLVPVFKMNLESNCISEIDNTMLPELEENYKTTDIDNYISKRIGLRKEAIDTNIMLNDKIFGELEHPTYWYGQNGYVYFQSLTSIYTPDVEFLDAFCRYLSKIQKYCNERNVPFIYCINPSKTSVYTQYLPKGYIYDNRFLKTLYEKLNVYGVNWISTVELLEEKAKTEQVFHVAYDPGHWNDLGHFYGNNHLLSKVAEYFPTVKQRSIEEFDFQETTYQTLTDTYFSTEEKSNVLIRKQNNVEDITSTYQGIKLHKNYQAFACFRRLNTSTDLPKTLFFHGSYYNRKREFYSDVFEETYAVHNYQNLLDFSYYFNIFQPECVILETAEYATNRGYFDFDALCNRNFNQPFEQVKDEQHTVKTQFDYEMIQESDRLCTIQINTQEKYNYGYLETPTVILDLRIENETIFCSFDKTGVDIKNAKLHFYQ